MGRKGNFAVTTLPAWQKGRNNWKQWFFLFLGQIGSNDKREGKARRDRAASHFSGLLCGPGRLQNPLNWPSPLRFHVIHNPCGLSHYPSVPGTVRQPPCAWIMNTWTCWIFFFGQNELVGLSNNLMLDLDSSCALYDQYNTTESLDPCVPPHDQRINLSRVMLNYKSTNFLYSQV